MTSQAIEVTFIHEGLKQMRLFSSPKHGLGTPLLYELGCYPLTLGSFLDAYSFVVSRPFLVVCEVLGVFGPFLVFLIIFFMFLSFGYIHLFYLVCAFLRALYLDEVGY